MKNTIQPARSHRRPKCLSALFAPLLVLPLVFGFAPEPPQTLTCPQPTNLTPTVVSTNAIYLSWTPATNITDHVVRYVRHDEKGDYESPLYEVTGSTHTLSGLAPGSYTIYVASSCGYGETSDIVVTEDIING